MSAPKTTFDRAEVFEAGRKVGFEEGVRTAAEEIFKQLTEGGYGVGRVTGAVWLRERIKTSAANLKVVL